MEAETIDAATRCARRSYDTREGKLGDVEQRVAFVFLARSPIDRLTAAKKARL